MHSYINSKYNRMLYFLLGFYIILVFVFSLLLNGFFINPHAYTSSNNLNNFNVTITQNTPNNPNEHGSSVFTFSSNLKGNNRGIFIYNEDVMEFAENNISGRLWGENIECPLIYVYTDRADGLTMEKTSSSGISPNINTMAFVLNGQELNNAGFPSRFLDNYGCVGYYAVKDYGQTIKADDSFKYVTSYEDLKKYLVDNDDSVVKTGNPTDPDFVNVDSQIPTPQKVAVYKDSSSPSLVWSNPKGIANNENIKVHIEWKPVITLTHGLYDVHSIISQDYEMLYFGEVGNYNSYCTLNNNGSPPPNVLNSYNTIYDSKVLFSGTGAQQSNDWANYFIVKNNVDWVSRVDPFGTNDLFGKGTYSGVRIPDLKYRIRYETENGVSDWIYSDREFDSDNVSGPSQHSSTHSRNASGDPISNPTYTPNNDNKIIPQNEIDDQDNPDNKKSNSIFDFISGFFDTIISAISAIFNKLKEIVDSISNGTGSFFSFFADLFGAFPQLLGIFLLGLVVTVLLRVLGR